MPEQFSKWHHNHTAGAHYRTLTFCSAKYEQIFAIEVSVGGRSRVYRAGEKGYPEALAEHQKYS